MEILGVTGISSAIIISILAAALLFGLLSCRMLKRIRRNGKKMVAENLADHEAIRHEFETEDGKLKIRIEVLEKK